MNKKRIKCIMLVFITIISGIVSRKISFIPLYIGDTLYAVMMYFIIRTIFLNSSIKIVSALGLLLCYLIEFSQLYKAPWINNIRSTLLGRLVLGQGFLVSDIIAYTVGILSVMLCELLIQGRKERVE